MADDGKFGTPLAHPCPEGKCQLLIQLLIPSGRWNIRIPPGRWNDYHEAGL